MNNMKNFAKIIFFVSFTLKFKLDKLNHIKLRNISLFLILILVTNSSIQVSGQAKPLSSIKGELEALDGIKSVKVIKCDTFFLEKYLLKVEQAINHKKKNSPTFTQRVWVGFKGRTKPTVFITEGYIGAGAGNPRYLNELCTYLDANMVLIEHRYFAESTPEPLDWKYHTIEQSANDHHHVNQLIKQVLTGKYISTGISKGGQTAMYYKYYFPDDVDVSVPYVAPLNFSIADKRINPFINNINGEECRIKIRDFQILCLQRQDKLMPSFNRLAESAGQHYTKAKGNDAAFEYIVLEYPFAFWQWGFIPCESIPDKNASDSTTLNHLLAVSPLDYFSDEGIEGMWPFFYQALTQIGYYDYDTTGMGQYFNSVHDLTFSFFNKLDTELRFKKKYMKRVDKFLKKNGNNMIYIYGEYDPWSAPAFVPVPGKTNALKVIKPGGSHITRIRNLPDDQKQMVLDQLENWLEIEVLRD